jgi:hypothetical protein
MYPYSDLDRSSKWKGSVQVYPAAFDDSRGIGNDEMERSRELQL